MIKFEKFQKIILNFFSLKTRINLNAIIIYRRIAIFQIKNIYFEIFKPII